MVDACSRVGRGDLVLRHSVSIFQHYILSGDTQRNALSCNQSEEVKTYNNSFHRLEIEPTTVAFTVRCCTTTTPANMYGM